MIAAWAGWPDAAESATRAVKELVRQLGAVKFGTLDPEDYYVTELLPRKLEIHARYARHYSFGGDLGILARTVRVLFT